MADSIDTGVSNGDVDWLFRGKSKKVIRKTSILSNNTDPSTSASAATSNQIPTTTTTTDTRAPPIDTIQTSISNEQSKTPAAAQKAIDPQSKLSVNTNLAPATSPKIESNLTSQFEKLKTNRVRSNSTGNDSIKVSKLRSSSLNDSISTTTPLNRSSSLNSNNGITEDLNKNGIKIPTPIPTSNASVSRSNSGSKRSIFSSISSKFKKSPVSSPVLTQPIAHTLSKPSHITQVSQPVASPQVSQPIGIAKRRVSTNKYEEEKSLSSSLKELDLNLKRVTFAINLLNNDPQQQIPSRRPKKGNVVIPEDLVAAPPRLSLGISTSPNQDSPMHTKDKVNEKELNLAIEAQKIAMIEAEKHAQEAHLAARRIALEVSQYKLKSGSTTREEDENEDDLYNVDKIEIDNPIHIHENHFDSASTLSDDSVKELSLELIYTRCCHLREILPIPATLKQLKNKSYPLQVLKLLNPRPTLIDVLSFSDFIAITPIITIIFDNVTMTTEMLKAFLSSLLNNKSLEKLSLRNVAIDNIGWKYLCKFISQNQTIKKLDISQQRIKSDTPQSSIRSGMDWGLFIESLVMRGGIEELVINGCKLTDAIFNKLVQNGVKIATQRLGIASTDLNIYKAEVVGDWINDVNSKCIGIDIAFNDLSQGQLVPLTKSFNESSKLVFFSLNSTHLSDINETISLIRALSKIPTLRFLDLSCIPNIFPGIISCLNKYLPRFKNLRRIHFDVNELTSSSIGAIAEILPKVPNLIHVSLMGNKNLTQSSGAALYAAIKNSKIYTLDLDFELVSDELSKRIAFYLMRNMERSMNSEHMIDHLNENPEDLMFDGSLLMETAEKLLESNNNEKLDLKTQKILTDALVERTRSVRSEIHKTIDSLFEKRNQGVLNLEMKEMLLRFCLLDSSLEKLVNIFEEETDFQSKDELVTPAIAIAEHDHLHESSTGLITSGPILSPHGFEENSNSYFPSVEQPFQPHQVVIDSLSDGKSVPIDNSTGRPVLIRSISQTSEHAKRQEEEEGEFHRWGFFVQQQNSMYPEERVSTAAKLVSSSTAKSSNTSNPNPIATPLLNTLPSGSELRDAIIKAKGIESVTELIDKINHNRVSIDNIYNYNILPTSSGSAITNNNSIHTADTSEGHSLHSTKSPASPINSIETVLKNTPGSGRRDENDEGSIKSIDSMDDEKLNGNNVDAVVDEVYEKLLNDAQRVRSNK